MSSEFSLPSKGYVYWPVGTGDSCTIVVDKSDDAVIQVDLHHLEKAEDDDEPEWPIVDRLVETLPKKGKKPYLAVFVLTHPDKDHIKGFAELLSKVQIGEIWHTPRIFTTYKKDLCDDAKSFKKEVERRRDVCKTKKGEVESGDRVLVIGHDDIFETDEYKDFPSQWRITPGNTVTSLDGKDYAEVFTAFIHGPFKDECDTGDCNETSLAVHITLLEGSISGKALFFGDRCYPGVKRIFEKTKEKKHEEYLEWDNRISAGCV